ncbi:hypothetical protein LJC49_05100 [Ruminococcaceae bacterium OttesenSCG-928-I18]|nr:hypothetical protein [Ruminococcaceae bacterium OttesenSCG-928-I18]
MNNDAYTKLEFTTIREMLAEHALCQSVKEKCLALAPDRRESVCRRMMDETTRAKNILDINGSPPLTSMRDVEEILTLCAAGAMLVPDQITHIGQFLVACRRMQHYLMRAESADEVIAS